MQSSSSSFKSRHLVSPGQYSHKTGKKQRMCCHMQAHDSRLAISGTCLPLGTFAYCRCSYVIEHADACYPDGGWQAYLRVHYCTFTGAW